MTVLDDDRELSDAIDEPPREPWYGTVMPVIALTAVALVAVAVAVSADLVVSREPVGLTGADDPDHHHTATAGPDHGADDRTDHDRSPVTSACLYLVSKPAGAGRTQRDAASAEANEPSPHSEHIHTVEKRWSNDASAVPPGNHRLRGAAGNEPLVVLSNVPARLL